jgi:hypothetical protein
MQPVLATASEGGIEYLNKVLESSKQRMLKIAERAPGQEYFFENLQLKSKLTDERLYREFWQRRGVRPESIDVLVEQNRGEQVAMDFQVLDDLCQTFRKAFHEVLGEGLPSFSAPLGVTFETSLQAGATPLPDGSNAVTICAGFTHFGRWFALRSLFDQVFPIFESSKEDRTIVLSPENQRMLAGFVEAMQIISRSALRDQAIGRGRPLDTAALAAEVMIKLDQVLRDPVHLQTLSKRSRWHTALFFILCHEFAHINLGHLDEVRFWHKNPPSESTRLQRRRQMEHEADSASYGAVLLLLPRILGYKFASRAELKAHVAREDLKRDYRVPILDLFTMFEMGHKGFVDFGPQSEYPTYERRYRCLISPKGELSPQHLAEAWSPAAFLTEFKAPFS